MYLSERLKKVKFWIAQRIVRLNSSSTLVEKWGDCGELVSNHTCSYFLVEWQPLLSQMMQSIFSAHLEKQWSA